MGHIITSQAPNLLKTNDMEFQDFDLVSKQITLEWIKWFAVLSVVKLLVTKATTFKLCTHNVLKWCFLVFVYIFVYITGKLYNFVTSDRLTVLQYLTLVHVCNMYVYIPWLCYFIQLLIQSFTLYFIASWIFCDCHYFM